MCIEINRPRTNLNRDQHGWVRDRHPLFGLGDVGSWRGDLWLATLTAEVGSQLVGGILHCPLDGQRLSGLAQVWYR